MNHRRGFDTLEAEDDVLDEQEVESEPEDGEGVETITDKLGNTILKSDLKV